MRKLVQTQLSKNIKLLNKVKLLNEQQKAKEVNDVKNNIIEELKSQLYDSSLKCKKQKFKRVSKYDVHRMKIDYILKVRNNGYIHLEINLTKSMFVMRLISIYGIVLIELILVSEIRC